MPMIVAQRTGRYLGILLFLLVTSVFAVWQTWGYAERGAVAELQRVGEHRLELYAQTLRGAIDRFSPLPLLLSNHPDIVTALKINRSALNERASRLLERTNAEAGTDELFILDAAGVVRASSNWRSPHNVVGTDVGFRPYLTETTLGHGRGFFGIDAATGEPGFYLSRSIVDAEKPIGAVIVKINLDPIEVAWTASLESVMLVDSDGVVLLASHDEWKYRSLATLAEYAGKRGHVSREFINRKILPLELTVERRLAPGTHVIRLLTQVASWRNRNPRYLVQERELAEFDWKLFYLSDFAPVRERITHMVYIAVSVAILIVLLALFLRERQLKIRLRLHAKDELESRVALRTQELRIANERLRQEVVDREQAERELKEAQEELIQSGKLAALGQLSAGIAHELNQPLAALRTYMASLRLLLGQGEQEQSERHLRAMSDLTERMGRITSHLKIFARKSPGVLHPTALQTAIDRAVTLIDAKRRLHAVELQLNLPQQALLVLADEVRLEQVFVNLLSNAIDATANVGHRLIIIEATIGDGRAIVSVADSGSGIAPTDLPRLFDPFFTTKEVGRGLGLGLSISYGIVTDLGGTLRVANRSGGGAVFTLTIPLHTAVETRS
ncbi:MAG: sensor histidine kinase [Gammaproteobacteria bacterium]|nr:sensor histidine kinase [Gammaproteobacteria bacterium]